MVHSPRMKRSTKRESSALPLWSPGSLSSAVDQDAPPGCLSCRMACAWPDGSQRGPAESSAAKMWSPGRGCPNLTMAPEVGVRPPLRAVSTGKRLSERHPSPPGALEASQTEWLGSEAPRGLYRLRSRSSGATPVCWLAVAGTLLSPLAMAAGTQVRRVGRRSSPGSKVLESSRSTA